MLVLFLQKITKIQLAVFIYKQLIPHHEKLKLSYKIQIFDVNNLEAYFLFLGKPFTHAHMGFVK